VSRNKGVDEFDDHEHEKAGVVEKLFFSM